MMITAISESLDLVAVVTNPTFTSRLAVPLYHVSHHGSHGTQTGTLQSTLTYKAVGELQSLCFAASFLCGLIQNGTSRTVVIWNVTRGVVVHTIAETDAFQILDMTTTTTTDASSSSSSALLVLIRTGSKIYVQEYSLDNSDKTSSSSTLFRMIRKIKAGTVEQNQQQDEIELAAHDTRIAIRNGASIKVVERETGVKLFKCKVASSGNASALSNASGRTCGTMVFNESYVGIVTHNQIQVFQEKGKVKCTVALSEQPMLVQLKGDYLLVDDSIYSISSSPTPTPVSTMTKSDTDSIVQLLFASETTVRAIVHGSKADTVEVHTLAFVQNGELVETLELPKQDEQNDEPAAGPATGKRPLTTSLTQTLGPGQAGTESLEVSDRPVKKIKKAAAPDEDEEPTIAERLKRLQQALDEEDEEEEIKFRPKQATTESLSHILQQALSSADDSMLELALDVRDAKVRQNSIDELTVDQATLLLNKLTARLAKKSSRASALVPWIQLVLLSGKIQSSAPLVPLKNLVQERIEIFPQLLQLEGRLSMLVNMS